MALATTVEQTSGGEPVSVVALEGELDGTNYQDLIATVQGIYEQGGRSLVLDLSGLTFISSAGLVGLHTVIRQMRGEGPADPEYGYAALRAINDDVDAQAIEPNVHVFGAQEAVQKVLDRTGLGTLFPSFPDRASALAAF